jgi:hypothetical protein
MNTLQKLTLMAFAILSAGVANAQSCSNCTPPTITPPTGNPGGPTCTTCGTTRGPGDLTKLIEKREGQMGVATSFVHQLGREQFACVDQAGPGGNTATVIQNPLGDLKDDNNVAYQTQSNPGGTSGVGSHGKNVAYALQKGSEGIVVQEQKGSGNVASAIQNDYDDNIAVQSQAGYKNQAFLLQKSGDNNFSLQVQRGMGGAGDGHDNYSAVTQDATNSHSIVLQEGAYNTSAVNQH